MTTMILGVGMLVAATLLFLIMLASSRRPVPPALMSDAWIANIHAPLMLGLFAFGFGFVVKYLFIVL